MLENELDNLLSILLCMDPSGLVGKVVCVLQHLHRGQDNNPVEDRVSEDQVAAILDRRGRLGGRIRRVRHNQQVPI